MKAIGIKLLALSAASVLLLAQSHVCGAILGLAQPYNAFIFQSMTESSDSEGALAVGGNATFTNYSVASTLGSSTTNLVVGGNLTLNGGSVNGSVIVGGITSISNAAPTGNLYTAGNYTGNNGPAGTVYYASAYSGPSWIKNSHVSSVTLPVDFNAAQTQLTQTSNSLSALANTGSYVNSYGSLTFTGTNSGMNVFSISEGTLASCYGVAINIPAGAYAIVNVTGSSSVTLPNVGFSLNSAEVLWNLNGASTVSMSSFDGSILAPSAAVSFSSGDLNGTLVANSLSGGGELHNVPFDVNANVPNLTIVPEYADSGLAVLTGLAIASTRIRRKTPSIALA